MISTVLVVVAATILCTASLVTVARIVRGPSVLDRVVALEVLIGIIICGLGLEAAVTRHTTTLPILISLSLVGFVGSVSVARYVRHDDGPLGGDEVR